MHPHDLEFLIIQLTNWSFRIYEIISSLMIPKLGKLINYSSKITTILQHKELKYSIKESMQNKKVFSYKQNK